VGVKPSTPKDHDSGGALSRIGFFETLTATSGVTVEGSYDSATNILTAATAKIVDETKRTGF